MTVKTTYHHIVLDDNDVAWLEETDMKVVELVLDHKAYGWSPEELHLQHPTLTLGQIYSALAYYWDHQEAFDEEIARGLRKVSKLQKQRKPTSLEIRLKAQGLL